MRAQPDDDIVRLVLADWYDEHGEPEKAEYIRIACEQLMDLSSIWIHKHGFRICDGLLGPGWKLKGRGKTWNSVTATYHMENRSTGLVTATFVRGMVHELKLTKRTWLDHAKALQLQPLRAVRFLDWPPCGVLWEYDEDAETYTNAAYPGILFKR